MDVVLQRSLSTIGDLLIKESPIKLPRNFFLPFHKIKIKIRSWAAILKAHEEVSPIEYISTFK